MSNPAVTRSTGDRTGTFYVDGCGGSFTFEDYMREIDAGGRC